ncbi:MAG: threonine aldolase family protein [Rhodospirillales bacterium]|nr:threonine aldolase family protein [Rhodospirillales bacterium]|tara:strand:- start:3521 stop:4558 length:1038 start_codon:yes stop_codon:yes gene_type:complete
MINPEVELFSDTKTRPGKAMLEAMMTAEVGDEQADEDPTTNALQKKVADLLGKEAALFVPSGTMCNQIAMAVHCQPGDEIIADKTAHIINFEASGPAVIARASIRPLDGVRGQFTVEQAQAGLRAGFRHAPDSKMIAVEQTANMGGGSIWPLEVLESLSELAKDNNLVTHMDGARLLNAVVASGVSEKDYAATVDTVWIDLSKGLGCPIGAVIAGSKEFIEKAWPWKQRLGGSMRQSGILAAAGIYALDHLVDRLTIDHANARLLATRLAQIPGVQIDPLTVETNILIIDVTEASLSGPEISAQLLEKGVRMGATGPSGLRAVTHLDVDEAGIIRAAEAFANICS